MRRKNAEIGVHPRVEVASESNKYYMYQGTPGLIEQLDPRPTIKMAKKKLLAVKFDNKLNRNAHLDHSKT